MKTHTRRRNIDDYRAFLIVALLSFTAVINTNAAVFELDSLGEDLRRAMIVRVMLSADGSAELVNLSVANGPPRANFGNPAHILIEYYDPEGELLGQHHEWDPRWVSTEGDDGGHVTDILDEAVGTFLVPLSGRIAELRISTLNAESAPSLLLRVNSVSTVTEFCLQNSSMAICEGFNLPPVAEAAGPYNVIVGQSVQLDGRLSADPEGGTLSYVWDLDGDAVFGESAADSAFGMEDGVTPFFSAAQITVPGPIEVAIRVCDEFDICDEDFATVNVHIDTTTGDADTDGIPDDLDLCPGTQMPESVPRAPEGLGRNRWAVAGTEGKFVQAPPQSGTKHSFSLDDTRGCSCEQIVTAAGLGESHLNKGCSTSTLLDWVGETR